MQCPLDASSLVGAQYIHAMSARSILIGGILFSDEAEILAASHQPSCRLLKFMYTYFNVAPSEPQLHRRDPTLGIAFELFRAPCLFPSQALSICDVCRCLSKVIPTRFFSNCRCAFAECRHRHRFIGTIVMSDGYPCNGLAAVATGIESAILELLTCLRFVCHA